MIGLVAFFATLLAQSLIAVPPSSTLPRAPSPTLIVADAPSSGSALATIVPILRGLQVTLPGNGYSVAKPLSCYSAPGRERCGARVTENALPSAEDYLQIYVADDTAEWDRNVAAVDKTAAPQQWVVKEDDPFTMTNPKTGGSIKLKRHCVQGLGAANTYAFCAIELTTHVIVESQMSPRAASTDRVTTGDDSTDDLDRAVDLALAGVAFVSDALHVTVP
jgi:hypothetical protein